MNLFLPLKEVWFNMTKSREKREDYREITGYWCSRLLLYNGKQISKAEWTAFLSEYFNPEDPGYLNEVIQKHFITFKPFSFNIMTLGYPSNTDFNRILKYKHEGIEIRTGNQEWGAEPNKTYFVIKHGKKLDFSHFN